MGCGLAIGGALAASSVAAGAMGAMGSGSPPAPQSFAGQLQGNLGAEGAVAPLNYQLQSQYQPLYQQLNLSSLGNTLNGGNGQQGLLGLAGQVQPQTSALQQTATATQLGNTTANLLNYGGGIQQAIQQANPQMAQLYQTLTNQAQSQLGANGVSPQEQSALQQGIRSAQAARGFGNGQADASQEGYYLAQNQYQRSQANQQFAGNVLGLGQQLYQNPALSMFNGAQGGLTATMGMLGAGQSVGAGAGPSLFNAQSPYAQSLYNTNFNAAYGTATNNQNANNGLISGGLSGLGGLIGGGISSGAFGTMFGGGGVSSASNPGGYLGLGQPSTQAGFLY